MVPREHKRGGGGRGTLHHKLQLLRSITNSHAENDTAIIVDASKYIEGLKQKVEELNQDIATSQPSSHTNPSNSPVKVTVERIENGFVIKAYSEKSCPGLLVTVLEAFEELGLSVVEARVSCTDRFHLQAVGGEEGQGTSNVDARLVKHTVLQAINNWSTAQSINNDHIDD